MLISFNWLKEYLDLSDVDPVDLGHQLSITGLEVENIKQPGQDISNIVVGEIVSCQAIPDTHLNATQVNVGQDSLQDIVCGAPNVQEGQKVIVALPGARLPGGIEIAERQMQGYPSNGMICSLQECGFSEQVVPKAYAEGIYVFPDEVEAGQDAKELLGLDDVIYDVDLTPNRSDALSMRGVAHEVGAILSQQPRFPEIEVKEGSSHSIEEGLTVSVDDPADAPIYKIRGIEDLELGESPIWLQRKIMASGMRPIDNFVDVTNYIMMEYGQPLHAFDYDLIEGQEIKVRRAQDEEILTTLDGKERHLSTEDIVITDGEKAIALAGVMGGENSHISDQTTRVALEAAVFSPIHIRRTAASLNLRSEASARFEKGVNLATVQDALDHAAVLLAELGHGKLLAGTAESVHVEAEDVEIPMTVSYLEGIIGTEFNKLIVFDILDRLGFDYEDGEDDSFTVIIPPRRWDIKIKADVAEEVARIYGYNNLPNSLPASVGKAGQLNPMQKLIRHTNRHLQTLGFNQALNYSLTTKEKANRFALEDSEDTTLSMPLSEEHQTLRKSLISGLLTSAQYNHARSQDQIFLYESGRVYHGTPEDDLLNEEEYVAALACGSWFDDWTKDSLPMDFYSLKGILQSLLGSYRLADPVRFEAVNDMAGMHPGQTAHLYLGDQLLGFIGQIHPSLADQYDLKEVFVFEMSLQVIHDAEKQSMLVSEIAKYPGISRDVALLLDHKIHHSQIVDVIEKAAGPWLQDIRLFDYYVGDSIEEGKKSMAYSLFYQNPNATLVEEEIQKDFEKVIHALEDELQADIR